MPDPSASTLPSAAKPRVPTIFKTGELLASFTAERPVWRLHDLSAELRWDNATTHRFLKALVEIRMLKCGADGAYRIGLLPLELAAVSLGTQPGREELLRVMEDLTEKTGLTTQLGVLEGSSVAIVASRESRSALKAAAQLGQRLPLHASAAGKALLSQMSERDVDRLLPAKLERFTGRTITSRIDVVREIQEARGAGFASADSELSEGLYALAIPIPVGFLRSDGAALTCAGIARSLNPGQWDIAEAALRQQAERFAEWKTTDALLLTAGSAG